MLGLRYRSPNLLVLVCGSLDGVLAFAKHLAHAETVCSGPLCRGLEPAMELFDRITQLSEVMGGKPCIRGTRVTVA